MSDICDTKESLRIFEGGHELHNRRYSLSRLMGSCICESESAMIL